ncbi:MAG: hypothetical protein AAGB31_08690 [Bdellovibrio sp.]
MGIFLILYSQGMGQRYGIILIIIALMGGLYWFQTRPSQGEFVSSTRVPASVVATPRESPDREGASPPALDVDDTPERRTQLAGEFQTLQDHLYREQQKLQQIQQHRETMETQLNNLSLELGAAEALSGQNSSEVLGQIQQEVFFYQMMEEELHRQVAESLRNQSDEARWAQEQLDEEIRLREQSLQQIREDYGNWRLNINNLTEQTARLSELETQWSAAQDELAGLRAQRMEISSALLTGRRDLQAQLNQARREIASEKGDLREQIFNLRHRERARSSQVSLRTQVAQAQRTQQQQEELVNSLEQQVSEKENQIRAFDQPTESR